MALSLVRERNGAGGKLPNSDAITKCMNLSTTTEAAEYLEKSANEIYNKAGLSDDPGIKKVLEILVQHKDYIRLATDNRNTWLGKPPTTVFEKRQDDLAAQASKLMGEKAASVRLDFALSEDSQLLRGYLSNGEPLDESRIAAMDKLFNACLANRDENYRMITKDGIIYKGTVKGDIEKDENGQDKKADPKEIRAAIQGFEQYVQRTNKSAHITVVEQNFPGAPAAVAAAEAEPAGPA